MWPSESSQGKSNGSPPGPPSDTNDKQDVTMQEEPIAPQPVTESDVQDIGDEQSTHRLGSFVLQQDLDKGQCELKRVHYDYHHHDDGAGIATVAYVATQEDGSKQEEGDTLEPCSPSGVRGSTMPTAAAPEEERRFEQGPFKNQYFKDVATSQLPEHVCWIEIIRKASSVFRAKYQEEFLRYMLDKGLIETLGIEDDLEYETIGDPDCTHELVCKSCGYNTTSRKDAKSCPHANLTRLNSTDEFVRHLCLDCNTVVESITKQLYRVVVEDVTKSVASQVEHASSRVIGAFTKLANDAEVPSAEAVKMIRLFAKIAQDFCSKQPTVWTSDLHCVLSDCADAVRGPYAQSGSAQERSSPAEEMDSPRGSPGATSSKGHDRPIARDAGLGDIVMYGRNIDTEVVASMLTTRRVTFAAESLSST